MSIETRIMYKGEYILEFRRWCVGHLSDVNEFRSSVEVKTLRPISLTLWILGANFSFILENLATIEENCTSSYIIFYRSMFGIVKSTREENSRNRFLLNLLILRWTFTNDVTSLDFQTFHSIYDESLKNSRKIFVLWMS